MIAEYKDADDDIVRWQSADGTVKTAHINDLILAYEPKRGKWTKHTFPDCTYFICSLCGWESIDSKTIYDDDGWYVDEVGMNYCPNCGARMERSEDGET